MSSAPTSSPRVLGEETGSQPPGAVAARRRAARRRRRRLRLLRTGTVLAAVVGLLVVLLTGSGSGGGSAAPEQVTVRVTLPRLAAVGTVASAAAITLPWPGTGQAAVEVPAVGYAAQSGHEAPVPVASMTKIMTAYVVLEDHPLALGQEGPRVRITEADAEQFGTDTVTDQASVVLQAGEVLTEYQLLEGLLVHSANDFAYALACWDAGSVAAFVARMNATATALGMRDTHFADASGLSPSSVSTAANLLRVASAAMDDPVFERIVAMPSVDLPFAGSVESYTPLVATTGVVGVKSGFTDAAGGGDVLAYRGSVDGHAVLVLAAVTSQQGPTVLDAAGAEALAIARAATAHARAVTVVEKGTVVALLEAAGRAVEVTTAAGASVLSLLGGTVRQQVHLRVPRPGTRAGTRVGTASFVLAGQRVSVPVRVAARVP